MQILRALLVLFIATLLNACADFYGSQTPAPVFGGSSEEAQAYPPAPESQGLPPQPEPPVTETKPLEGYGKSPEIIEMKPELPPPAQQPQPIPPEGMPDQSMQPNDPFATEQPLGTEPPQIELPDEEQPKPAENQPAAPPVAEAPKQPEELQPLETFAPQSPAVGSLVMAANEDSQGGNLDSAVSSIERAIRIEPRNPTLYYKLSLLRLQQSKPRLAEDLARKAALLAVNDKALKKHSWLLVAKAREEQNNTAGADKARAEADKY